MTTNPDLRATSRGDGASAPVSSLKTRRRPLPEQSPAFQEVRLVLCGVCGSEGRIIRAGVASAYDFDPPEIDLGACPVCQGTGSELVAVEMVTEEEIMEGQG